MMSIIASYSINKLPEDKTSSHISSVDKEYKDPSLLACICPLKTSNAQASSEYFISSTENPPLIIWMIDTGYTVLGIYFLQYH